MDYDVAIAFKADDRISATLKSMTGRVSTFGTRATGAFSRAERAASGFRSVMGGILGASVIQRGFGFLTGGIREMTTEFLDFDSAVTNASAKWGIQRGTEDFRELGRVARDVAKVTPYSAGQAGQGLDFLAMAGFSASQAMAALPGVTQLAIASNTELAEASDIASDALSSLGLMSRDSAQLTENLARVNDVFAKTTITSNTNLQMLFEGMKEVAPVATGLGRDVEELSAMMGTLANSGIKSTQAGTALRNMFLRLTGGTREVTKVLDRYKIKVTDSSGKMRSMIDVLDEVRQKTAKLDDKTKQAAYTHLFGARAVASATILMKAGGDELHRYEQTLRDATGASKQLADEMSKSWSNRLKAIKSQLIELGLKVFDVFENEIPKAFKAVEQWLADFDGESFKQWVMDTYNEMKPLAQSAFTLGKGLIQIANLANTLGGGLDVIVVGLVSFKVAAGAAAIAAGAFNIAAFPITATLGAIGVAGYLLYKNQKTVMASLQSMWEDLAYSFMSLLNKLSFGHLEAVVGKGAAATFRAMDEMKRRAKYKKSYSPITEEDLGSLTGAGEQTSVFGKSVKDIFNEYPNAPNEQTSTPKESVGDVFNRYSTPMAPEGFKSESTLNVFFDNAPAGTTASVKRGKGAPKITSNLGAQ